MENENKLNLTNGSSELEDISDDSCWEDAASSELESYALKIRGISELSDNYADDTQSSTPVSSKSNSENANTSGFCDSSFTTATFLYTKTILGEISTTGQGFPEFKSPEATASSSSGSPIESPASSSTMSSGTPLSSRGSSTSSDSRRHDFLSGVNLNYGSRIRNSKRLRIQYKQVQEGLMKAKQYNIVRERLELLLSIMSARKALGNPLTPQEIPADLYSIIFHPQSI